MTASMDFKVPSRLSRTAEKSSATSIEGSRLRHPGTRDGMSPSSRKRTGHPRGRPGADFSAGLPDHHDPTAGIGGAAPARSALTLRLVLAAFGLVVCVVFGVLSLRAD